MIKNTIIGIAAITSMYAQDYTKDDDELKLVSQNKNKFHSEFSPQEPSYSPSYDLDGRVRCLENALQEYSESDSFMRFIAKKSGLNEFNTESVKKALESLKIRIEHEDIHVLISHYYDDEEYKHTPHLIHDLKEMYEKQWKKLYGPSPVYFIQHIDSSECMDDSDSDN